MNSKNGMFAGLLMVLLFGAGCLVTQEPQVRTVVYAPPLPSVVVFETEPYYVQQGYHYHYQHDRWYYSRSRSGPWTMLPRDRYPREVRYRDSGPQIVIAPPLPPLVVFETEPYYVHQGYHYHYQNNGWYYSRLKSGPWTSLPRDRYPKEVRYRDGRHGDDKGRAPHIAQPIPEHRERVQPTQEHKSPTMPPSKYPVNVQPVQPVKPRVLPPTQNPEITYPPKEIKPRVLPPTRSPEITYPPKEQKIPVLPPTKHTQNVQPSKEGRNALPQSVVQPPGVVTPSVGSKTQHLERVRSQKQPIAGHSGKPVSIQKGAPEKPVAEGKDKEALEANKGKWHSRD